MSEDEENPKSDKVKSERKDVPVDIGGEKVSTDPNLVRSIQLGEEDKEITEMIRKRTIKKS